jgi:hypothetical protein
MNSSAKRRRTEKLLSQQGNGRLAHLVSLSRAKNQADRILRLPTVLFMLMSQLWKLCDLAALARTNRAHRGLATLRLTVVPADRSTFLGACTQMMITGADHRYCVVEDKMNVYNYVPLAHWPRVVRGLPKLRELGFIVPTHSKQPQELWQAHDGIQTLLTATGTQSSLRVLRISVARDPNDSADYRLCLLPSLFVGTQLAHLVLSNVDVDPPAWNQVAVSLPSVRELEASSAEALVVLRRHASMLQTMRLSGSAQMNHEQVLTVSLACRLLVKLDVQAQLNALPDVFELLPQLEYLSIVRSLNSPNTVSGIIPSVRGLSFRWMSGRIWLIRLVG